jgi:hypothetical protein
MRSSRRIWLALVLAAVVAGACDGATAEPTTTILSCDTYGDEWAVAITEAGNLHLRGIKAINDWGAGDLAQQEAAETLGQIELDIFGLIERLRDAGPPPAGMEITVSLARDAISSLHIGYGSAHLALATDPIDQELIKAADTQLEEGAKLLVSAVESAEGSACTE